MAINGTKIINLDGLESYNKQLATFLASNYVPQKSGTSNAFLCRTNGVVTLSPVGITTVDNVTTIKLTTSAKDINVGNNIIPTKNGMSFGSQLYSWTAYLKDVTVSGTAAIATADIKTISDDTKTVLQKALQLNAVENPGEIKVATGVENGTAVPTENFAAYSKYTPSVIHVGDKYIVNYLLAPTAATKDNTYVWWKIGLSNGYSVLGVAAQLIGNAAADDKKVAAAMQDGNIYFSILEQGTDEQLSVTLILSK